VAHASDKREPQRAAGLSRERILEAGLALAAEEGLEALSMRRLAQALDVWPMALYRYFRDKDELLDALVARATDEIERPPTDGSWREQMRDLLGATREALGSEALGLGERLPRALLTPGLVRLAEDGLRILGDAGFDADEAPRAWRALLAYTIGFAASGAAEEADFDYGLERLLDGLESRAGVLGYRQ
jgi:TetR/AcrR family transcriptional regulator, tetracycline repressor protein